MTSRLWKAALLGCFVGTAGCEAAGADGEGATPSIAGETDEAFVLRWWRRHGGAHGHGHGHGHHGPKPPPQDCQDAGSPPPEQEPSCGWQRYDQGLNGANVSQVVFDPRAAGVAYATVGAELYRSEDSGETWQLQGVLPESAFSQLLLAGEDPAQLLANTGSGMVVSLDEGQTWSPHSLDGVPLTAAAGGQDPLRVYTALNGAGVFRSNNGGRDWAQLGSGFPYASATAISVDPRDDDTLVVSLALLTAQGGYGAGALVRTTDGGITWREVYDARLWMAQVARCPADPNVLFAAGPDGLVRSADNGESWQLLPIDGYPFVEGVTFLHDGCDDLFVYQYTVGPRRTSDGGMSFGPPLTGGLELSPFNLFPGRLVVDPADPTHLLMATHGGLYGSHDAGTTWALQPGFQQMNVVALASSPQHPGRTWLAGWGTGVWSRASAHSAWQRLPVSALPADYIQSLFMDPYVPDRLFVGAQGASYRSLSAGAFSAVPLAGNLLTVAAHPARPNVLFAGTQVSGIHRSDDGGLTWTPSNGGLTPWPTPNGQFLDIRQLVIDPHQPDTLYAGAEYRGVLKSRDAGASWQSVLESDHPSRCLRLVPGTPALLYACVDGVQRSSDGGESWQDVSEGLTTLDVGQLVHDESTGYLYVTSGDGVFVKRGEQPWQALEAHCLPSAGSAVIVREGAARRLVVASGSSVYARSL